MVNIIIATIVIVLVGAATFYIWHAKKKGKKCIGCPCSGTGSCHCNMERKLCK